MPWRLPQKGRQIAQANLISLNGVNLAQMPYIFAPDGKSVARMKHQGVTAACCWWRERQWTMGYVIKLVVAVAVLGLIGLSGYAYLADLAPVPVEMKLPVVLHGE